MVGRCRLTLSTHVKAPATKRLKLKCDGLLLSFGFKFNLHRYNVGGGDVRTRRAAWASGGAEMGTGARLPVGRGDV